MMKNLKISGGVLLTGVILAGCAAGAPPVTGDVVPPPAGATAPTGGSASGGPTSAGAYQPLPLDAYRFSSEQQRQYQQAVRLLRDKCLATFGFQPYLDPPVFTGTEKYLRATVTEDGYGIATTAEDLAFEKAERDYAAAYEANPPSAAYLLVDQGTSKRSGLAAPSGTSKTINGKKVYPTGCTGWAQDKISTKDRSEGTPRQLKPINDAAWTAYATDPALAALNKAWSACMKAQGYKFSDPPAAQDAATSAGAEGNAGPPEAKPAAAPEEQSAGGAAAGGATGQDSEHSDAERAIARADLACRAQTSYDDKAHQLQAKHQRAAIEANAELLAGLQRDLADELRAAAAVVAGGGATP